MMTSPTDAIALEPADYWRVQAVSHRLEAVKLGAAAVVAAAEAACGAALRDVASRYPGFEPTNAQYAADDATFTLTRTR